MTAATPTEHSRLAVLDGWRGISILLVLAAHLLPVGAKAWQGNEMAARMGMALFFILSGFLITRFLLGPTTVPDFLVRRFFRIAPLAWAGMVAALLMAGAPAGDWWPHFAFVANLPPPHLTAPGAHLWSLCVEAQFYVAIALLVACFGRRGLVALPWLCLAVTTHRIIEHAYVDIVTWRRVDEILAGGVLAMAWAGKFGAAPSKLLARLNPYALLFLLAVASHPDGGFMNYARPYVAAMLVGATLFGAAGPLTRLLGTRVLAYVATISYALYIVHHLLVFTWLGEGQLLAKYLKRPLLIAATFLLAHVSTFYFEQPLTALGKRLTSARRGRSPALP